PAERPQARHGRAWRTPGHDDPWSACPWPAAPGRARWWVLESGENAFQYAKSWASFPGWSRFHKRSNSIIRRACPPPGGSRQCTRRRASALPRPRTGCKTGASLEIEPMATTRAEKARNSTESDALAARLRREISGEVLFDPFNRGRYATDASFYQIMPAGVVVPRTLDEARRTLAIARDHGQIVTPRGGGTSQCGQTVNDGIVIDVSKYLKRIVSLDVDNRVCAVEPGIVLDDLTRQLKPHGLWFPVDVSTASRATIGGMAGNNSCGGRSLRYGTMRDNTLSMDATLADGRMLHFG